MSLYNTCILQLSSKIVSEELLHVAFSDPAAESVATAQAMGTLPTSTQQEI